MYRPYQCDRTLGSHLLRPVAAPGGRLLGVWNAWFRPGPPNSRAGDCEVTIGSELTGRTLTSATAGGSLADGALQAATTSTPTIAIRTVIMPPSPPNGLDDSSCRDRCLNAAPDVAEV